MAPLTRSEAQERAALIDVTGYELYLDLDRGDEHFGSRSRIRFTCTTPGAATFLDLKAHSVESIWLNGGPIDPVTVHDGRVVLADLQAENTIVVEATMSYGNDGQGLHRSVDPADGRHYVYGMSFLDAAPQIYACFDQPDLKAPYDVLVHAPHGWTVAGNGSASQHEPGGWRLATTKPLATYFFTICAGPYATVHDRHDGIDMWLHVRRSLEEQLLAQADEIFTVTKQSFDYYHQLFGIRYPWGDYHQFFVPEFNAGAMENPGCVTFRDSYIFRGAYTRQRQLTRANTIAHEMAHMWFGDLVTMKWWDDLWLNESFAEYMAHRTLVGATEYDDAWVDFGIVRKVWGYGVDRGPSTHPIAGAPAPDSDSALTNFDGISYAKGASALRQLAAYVGDDAFVAGVRDHLTTHSFGNATMHDFIGSVERASGQDLSDWTAGWLGTAQADELRLDLTSEGGTVTSATLVRSAPAAHPASRPHVLDIATFTDGRQTARMPVRATSDSTPVDDLVGLPTPSVVLPNAGDLTWAEVRLDPATLAALPTQLPLIDDALARLTVWSALVGGVARAEVDPRQVAEVFAAAWPVESNTSITGFIAAWAGARLPYWYVAENDSAAVERELADAGAQRLAAVDPASSDALVAASLIVATTDDADLLARWAANDDRPAIACGDDDFGWSVVKRQALLGLIDEAVIDAAAQRDNSMSGKLSALGARAALPGADAKRWAWDRLVGDQPLSNYEASAIGGAFFGGAGQVEGVREILAPYVPRYFTELPKLAGKYGEMALANLVHISFPAQLADPSVAAEARRALESGELTAGIRRAFVDGLDELERVIAVRSRFGS